MAVPRILHYPSIKWNLSDWLIDMPQHTTYLEPFFGSGAVLFNKVPSQLETVNDLDGDVVNLFRIIRERPEELAGVVHWTPYARRKTTMHTILMPMRLNRHVECRMTLACTLGGGAGE
ncbi:DNA adenine methylase [Paenibacillus baimaensis]|uniref:DNA adenine methylase n=1 Tax=Paenibacillus baimaensis TaxID=2982185 RepID=UPI00293F11DF|nr:DNA adenine methylase [Paenibacillus sp. WQ 127069]